MWACSQQLLASGLVASARPVLEPSRGRLSAGSIYALVALRLHARVRRPAAHQLRDSGSSCSARSVPCTPRFLGINPDDSIQTGFTLVAVLLVCLAFAMLWSGGAAVLLERIAYRPLRKRGATRLAALISAIGASLAMQQLMALRLKHGTNQVAFPRLVAHKTVFTFFGADIRNDQIIVIVSALVMMVALDQFVGRTRLGRGIRAISQDSETATLMGVSIDRVVMLTFLLGGLMAGAAGFSRLLPQVTKFSVGTTIGIRRSRRRCSVASAHRGALLGGLALRHREPHGRRCGGPVEDVIAFLVLVLVLMIRPTGLLGESLGRRLTAVTDLRKKVQRRILSTTFATDGEQVGGALARSGAGRHHVGRDRVRLSAPQPHHPDRQHADAVGDVLFSPSRVRHRGDSASHRRGVRACSTSVMSPSTHSEATRSGAHVGSHLRLLARAAVRDRDGDAGWSSVDAHLQASRRLPARSSPSASARSSASPPGTAAGSAARGAISQIRRLRHRALALHGDSAPGVLLPGFDVHHRHHPDGARSKRCASAGRGPPSVNENRRRADGRAGVQVQDLGVRDGSRHRCGSLQGRCCVVSDRVTPTPSPERSPSCSLAAPSCSAAQATSPRHPRRSTRRLPAERFRGLGSSGCSGTASRSS